MMKVSFPDNSITYIYIRFMKNKYLKLAMACMICLMLITSVILIVQAMAK